MFSIKKSAIALIAVLTLVVVEARAQSFTITDTHGVVFVNTSVDGGPPTLIRPPNFNLSGEGLSVTAFSPIAFGGDTGSVEARDTCLMTLCGAGTVLTTNSSFSGTLRQGGAMATVNGVNFQFLRLTGSLNFVSEPIVLPSFGGDFSVTIPFTFSGQIDGDQFSTPIFTATLSGQGWATFLFWDDSRDLLHPHFLLYAVEYHFEPLPISIDIKPDTFPNSINPKSQGKIAVALLTTEAFDATAVDPTTVLFGATGIEAEPVHSAMEDVDGDGDTDLVFHFISRDTGITCGTGSATLTGAIFAGPKITGSDSIETVGCK
jgi:hypothetical protein